MRSIYAAGAPPMLRVAAAAQLLEAAGLCVAAVYQLIEALTGHSYQESSGIALAVLEVLTAGLMALIAMAMARLRPWSRTPGVMTQICVALLAVILIQSHQYAWGLPTLVLAVAGLVGLFSPASLRALRRPAPAAQDSPGEASRRDTASKPATPAKKPAPAGKPPTASRPTAAKPAMAKKPAPAAQKRK